MKDYIIIITVANMGNARTLNATVFFKGHQCSKHSVAELGTTVLKQVTAQQHYPEASVVSTWTHDSTPHFLQKDCVCVCVEGEGG